MDRFWSRVNKTETCWLWTGAKNLQGYGQIYLGQYRKQPAHRFAYEMLVGPIPDGLVIDHLCRVTSCVNPAHLEPVTAAENTRRGELGATNKKRAEAISRCAQGHLYDEANTYIRPTGFRDCRACIRDRARRYYAKRTAA